tara:strand:- start:578 stop:1111 length:534 start_codon:yes stop_codon:yes gene_type:complete
MYCFFLYLPTPYLLVILDIMESRKPIRTVATNRKAYYDYAIEDTFEAGLALLGTEVKALREGRVNLKESFARIDHNEVILHNCHINEYSHGNIMNHIPRRERRLLLHRKEIDRLVGQTQRKGLTLIPLKIYFTDRGLAKLQLALARGKRQYDRREDIKKREDTREIARAMKEERRGR